MSADQREPLFNSHAESLLSERQDRNQDERFTDEALAQAQVEYDARHREHALKVLGINEADLSIMEQQRAKAQAQSSMRADMERAKLPGMRGLGSLLGETFGAPASSDAQMTEEVQEVINDMPGYIKLDLATWRHVQAALDSAYQRGVSRGIEMGFQQGLDSGHLAATD